MVDLVLPRVETTTGRVVSRHLPARHGGRREEEEKEKRTRLRAEEVLMEEGHLKRIDRLR